MGDFQALTGLPGPAVEPETLPFWRHSQLSPVPLTAGRLCHYMLPKDLQWNQEHFLAAFTVVTSASHCWNIVSLYAAKECLALLVACLCHDLDHRATNNSFQIKASSPLAQLYTTSTMEHHHFDQSVMILNSCGNQILSNCTPDEYSRVISVLEDAILATDLAVYIRKQGGFFSMVKSKQCHLNRKEVREQVRGMMMTVCDIAAITKPWPIQKQVAELVAGEFFEQGDIGK